MLQSCAIPLYYTMGRITPVVQQRGGGGGGSSSIAEHFWRILKLKGDPKST